LESISEHYKTQFFSQIYKIIGSLDIIGNPIGLFSDLDTGLFDLFYEPINGITRSPEEFTKFYFYFFKYIGIFNYKY
jgi:vacuolar protein sorting-associated protein 13A/C